MNQFLKTSSTSGTPVALKSTKTNFNQALLIGFNTLSRTNNTGDVYIGFSSSANEQPILITPGGTYLLDFSLRYTDSRPDLAAIYLDVATNGDGLVVVHY